MLRYIAANVTRLGQDRKRRRLRLQDDSNQDHQLVRRVKSTSAGWFWWGMLGTVPMSLFGSWVYCNLVKIWNQAILSTKTRGNARVDLSHKCPRAARVVHRPTGGFKVQFAIFSFLFLFLFFIFFPPQVPMEHFFSIVLMEHIFIFNDKIGSNWIIFIFSNKTFFSSGTIFMPIMRKLRAGGPRRIHDPTI